MGKRSHSSSNNAKYLKFCGRKVVSTRNSNFGEISDSNLETGGYGPKFGVSWIIRESWQHRNALISVGKMWLRARGTSRGWHAQKGLPCVSGRSERGRQFCLLRFPLPLPLILLAKKTWRNGKRFWLLSLLSTPKKWTLKFQLKPLWYFCHSATISPSWEWGS